MSVPAIVHLMYFPWDRDQRLKTDPEDFDHTPVDLLRKYAVGMEVKLWTYPAAKALCEQYYPAVWEALRNIARPVMLVDVLRWVVVHHFGGLYWQINTTPLVPMAAYLPPAGKNVRLFTEFDLTPEQCCLAMNEPIRAGEPEETKRIMIQVFAAEPGAPFVTKVIQLLQERVRQYRLQRDYDVLFITGNAAASTAYDRFGRDDPGVELTGLAEARRMIKLHYQGSWRTDPRNAETATTPRIAPAEVPLPTGWCRSLRNFYYRFLVPHPHDTAMGQHELMAGERTLGRLLPLIHNLDISRVVEIADAPLGTIGLQTISIHPSRAVIAKHKQEPGTVWRHINLFYSTLPKGDLFVCPNYLEWISFGEAHRILARITAAGFRYVALTDHPLLAGNWDAALGDFRPLNMGLEPFHFGQAVASVEWPDSTGRPDRRVTIWEMPSR